MSEWNSELKVVGKGAENSLPGTVCFKSSPHCTGGSSGVGAQWERRRKAVILFSIVLSTEMTVIFIGSLYKWWNHTFYSLWTFYSSTAVNINANLSATDFITANHYCFQLFLLDSETVSSPALAPFCVFCVCLLEGRREDGDLAPHV